MVAVEGDELSAAYEVAKLEHGLTHLDSHAFGIVAARHDTAVVIASDDHRTPFEARAARCVRRKRRSCCSRAILSCFLAS